MRGAVEGTGGVTQGAMPTPCKSNVSDLHYFPVTSERLTDVSRFSAEFGRFGYCSCMRWRMPSAEYRRSSKEDRAQALAARVIDGEPTGILAYDSNRPIAWCSVGPRESYAALERYRALPRIDDAAVWSVVCFFVSTSYRRKGLTLGLLKAAADYAASQGASIVEGYPVEPGAPSYTFMGSPNTFRRAGFDDVTPAGQKRIVMRRHLGCKGAEE